MKSRNNSCLFTTGFTKKSAQTFFSQLRRFKVKKLIDIRLNTTSQFFGFAKRDDLELFLKELDTDDPDPRVSPDHIVEARIN